MYQQNDRSNYIFVDHKGLLACEYYVPDPQVIRKHRGYIEGIIDFEDEPEFCDDRHIYRCHSSGGC
ncbi:MAG: hypothetical protein AAGB22_07850 [Bacteroidota bacterium]